MLAEGWTELANSAEMAEMADSTGTIVHPPLSFGDRTERGPVRREPLAPEPVKDPSEMAEAQRQTG